MNRSSGSGFGFWLRWSWRDLRARWIQVVAIALVIALGTGSYAGLSSVTRWRRISTDDAYQTLSMYDLRVSISEKAVVPAGELLDAVKGIPNSSSIAAANERLIADIQVDASKPDETIIVPGLIYGLDLASGGPAVNGLHVVEGRTLTPEDAGQPVALLESNFARYYELPASGSIQLSGGRELDYAGQALTPEYFLVTTEQGGLLAEANFAAVFTSLETAQALTGNPGMVNDLVLRLTPGADRETVRREIAAALSAQLPEVGAEVTTRQDDPSYRLNDEDIKGDQQIYDIFAVLIFAGALGASFNLATRIVEQQRREIGIAMVLGLPPSRIAIRPLLVGAEIALMGVVFGVGVGYVIGESIMSLARELQPLPQWQTPFQWRLYGIVATMGFFLPFAATAWPVWRAVRVPPIEAIRPAYRSSKGGGLAPLLRRLHLPGNTLTQAPIRNVVRAPRRTILTSLGIAAALAALVAFIGMIDSFIDTIDRGDQEILGTTPERLDVHLAGFLPEDSEAVQAALNTPSTGLSETGAKVGGTVGNGDQQIDLQIEFIDMESSVWRPTIIEGAIDRQTQGIYLSEIAARDLSVKPGDEVTLRHPTLQADGAISLTETTLLVLGIHPHPFRFIAYVDKNHLALLAPTPVVNLIKTVPAEGASADQLKQELFQLPVTASIEQVGDVAQAIRDLLNEFVVVLRVVEGAMLLIAVLIAFNSASINMDERTREHATMFAFGVPPFTVLRMAIVENLIIGAGATVIGLTGGWFLLRLIMATRVADTFPDIYIKPVIAPETLALTVLLGVVLVALAPVFTLRRLRSMNVASSLKIVE